MTQLAVMSFHRYPCTLVSGMEITPMSVIKPYFSAKGGTHLAHPQSLPKMMRAEVMGS